MSERIPYGCWSLWSYRAVLTQSNVGGGGLQLDITAGTGNIIHILYATCIGAFGAGKTMSAQMSDEDNTENGSYVITGASTTATGSIPRALTDVDSGSNSRFVASLGGIWLVGLDQKLTWVTNGAAQNDTITLALQAKVLYGAGTVSAALSGGTPSLASPTVNEVY